MVVGGGREVVFVVVVVEGVASRAVDVTSRGCRRAREGFREARGGDDGLVAGDVGVGGERAHGAEFERLGVHQALEVAERGLGAGEDLLHRIELRSHRDRAGGGRVGNGARGIVWKGERGGEERGRR